MYCLHKWPNSLSRPEREPPTGYFVLRLFFCIQIFSAHSAVPLLHFLHIPSLVSPLRYSYGAKRMYRYRLLFLKCPQLINNEIQRNRNQQVYNRCNRFAHAEERNLHPKQNIRKDRRAAVTDIGLAQPLELAAPVIGVAGKDNLSFQKNALAILRIVPRMLPTIYRSGLIHRKI